LFLPFFADDPPIHHPVFPDASLQAVPFFIGTNTGKNSTSKGIYLADFDSATSNLSEPALAAVALVVLGLFR
jgi:hypothetical protein